jgi:hypothetical protein
MKNDEQNKNDDAFYFNKIILGNRKAKKETKDQKRERIRLRMLTILNSLEKILQKK